VLDFTTTLHAPGDVCFFVAISGYIGIAPYNAKGGTVCIISGWVLDTKDVVLVRENELEAESVLVRRGSILTREGRFEEFGKSQKAQSRLYMEKILKIN
jgi:hypothetical protein